MPYFYTMQTELKDALHLSMGIPTAQLHEIVAFFQPRTIQKNDFFHKGDRVANQMGFLQSGFVREFFVDDAGREVTKWIARPGDFIMDVASFMFHQPARWSFQALTDCQLLVLSQADYERIGMQIPLWTSMEKLFIAKCFMVLENRIVSHLSMSSEERYKLYFAQNPELFNQVPLQYLASMLGMTPETFSRIRKKHSLKSS